jgi:hypothetical protein
LFKGKRYIATSGERTPTLPVYLQFVFRWACVSGNTNWRYTGRVGVLSPLVAIYLFPLNNKRKRILNGQTRMGNPEKLAI